MSVLRRNPVGSGAVSQEALGHIFMVPSRVELGIARLARNGGDDGIRSHRSAVVASDCSVAQPETGMASMNVIRPV